MARCFSTGPSVAPELSMHPCVSSCFYGLIILSCMTEIISRQIGQYHGCWCSWLVPSHCLSQCWPRCLMPYGVTRPPLQWRHNGHDGLSNHQPNDCLLSRLYRCRPKKISTPGVTGLCAGNSPATSEFPHKLPVTWKMFPFDDVIMQ